MSLKNYHLIVVIENLGLMQTHIKNKHLTNWWNGIGSPWVQKIICCFTAKNAVLRSKAKTGWLRIMIMCQSGATCLSTDCCVSELAL